MLLGAWKLYTPMKLKGIKWVLNTFAICNKQIFTLIVTLSTCIQIIIKLMLFSNQLVSERHLTISRHWLMMYVVKSNVKQQNLYNWNYLALLKSLEQIYLSLMIWNFWKISSDTSYWVNGICIFRHFWPYGLSWAIIYESDCFSLLIGWNVIQIDYYKWEMNQI